MARRNVRNSVRLHEKQLKLETIFLFIFIYNSYDGYFVDLFVRISNSVAVDMYKKMGYIVYRQVIGYYSGEEDACGIIYLFLLILH